MLNDRGYLDKQSCVVQLISLQSFEGLSDGARHHAMLAQLISETNRKSTRLFLGDVCQVQSTHCTEITITLGKSNSGWLCFSLDYNKI